jgi:CheY-like chemotaxis protein
MAVVRGLLPMLTRVLGEQIEIVEDLGDTPSVLADPGQLEQIIVNLTLNARDAMTSGGRLTIRTSKAALDAQFAATHLEVKAGTYAMLEVRDTGTGMSDAVKARIFEPFFTTKDVGRGTGLGLATVYGIVKQTGGGISVSSQLGRGTTFAIYLPEVGTVADRAVELPPEPTTLAASGTVLLVEDEPAVRLLVASVLEQDGFRVLSAANPADALVKMARNTEPLRLIITDTAMPGASGPELSRALREAHKMKTLFVSGATQAIDRDRSDPDQQFLQQPFTGRELLGKVRQLLSQ